MAKRSKVSESAPADASEKRQRHMKAWLSEKELKVIRMAALLADQSTSDFGREALLRHAHEVLKKHGVSIE